MKGLEEGLDGLEHHYGDSLSQRSTEQTMSRLLCVAEVNASCWGVGERARSLHVPNLLSFETQHCFTNALIGKKGIWKRLFLANSGGICNIVPIVVPRCDALPPLSHLARTSCAVSILADTGDRVQKTRRQCKCQ